MPRATIELSADVEPHGGELSGWVWFALMVTGWIVFFVLIVFSEATLDGLHGAVRELPLLVELLVWFALFPFVLALTIWTSSWEEPVRLAVVSCCAIAWTIAFLPWRAVIRSRRGRRQEHQRRAYGPRPH